MSRPFFILIVIDGFGCRNESEFNAIAQAETPCFDRLYRDSSWTTLEASGRAVGLPPNQMGNSEVGHLNIGAGRIVDQDIVRISKAVSQHELETNPTFVDAVAQGGAIHFAGLLSDGGVHSMQTHLYGLIDAAIVLGAKDIFVHAILDGRDTPPKSAEKYLVDFAAQHSVHALVKPKPGRKPLSEIKVFKDDPAGIEAHADEIKARYTQIFKV